MAINQQTLAAAKTYTDDQRDEHEAAYDPHPHYAKLVHVDGSATGGRFIILKTTESLPPVERGSVLWAPPGGLVASGTYMANEAGTAWVQLGLGALPADTTPPSVPGNLRVTGKTTTSITVAWDASTDPETGVGGYDVSIDSGAWVPLGVVFTYTFGTLAAGSSHVLRVRARDKATTPNVSAAAALSDSTSPAPVTAPQNLRVSATGQTTLTFDWDAPASGTVSRYEWRLPSPGGTFASNGTAATKQVPGLTADTSYTFGVRAVFTDNSVSSEVTLTARTAAVSGGTGTMLFGIHVATPDSADLAANPELSIYQGMTQLQVLQKAELDMRTLTGFTDNPLMSIGHIFHGTGSGYTMKAWGTTQLGRMPALLASWKPDGGTTQAAMQATANGSEDAAIIRLIQSLPTGKRIYMAYFHEPADPINQSPTDGYIAAWRAAQARWARLIIDNRGARDIHPAWILTTYSFRPAAAAIQAKYLQLTDDYEAAGIDWRTQVVAAPDGYQDNSSEVNFDAATTFENVYPALYARGWRRFGLSETATCSKAGTAGSETITSADVNGASQWARSMVRLAVQYGFEYVCWFNTTGSKGPVGSWQYTNALKKTYGEAAHYRGPAPTWPTP